MILIICCLASILAVLYIFLPFLQNNSSFKINDVDAKQQQILHEVEMRKTNLEDLEHDYETGRIDSQEYQVLKKKF